MGALSELRARLRHRRDSLRCDEAVELVTEYLEDAMQPALRERFERHLRACGPCVRYVDQVRRTVDVLGHVHPEPPTGPTREALLDAFRDFRRE
jgi:hypothetical protein